MLHCRLFLLVILGVLSVIAPANAETATRYIHHGKPAALEISIEQHAPRDWRLRYDLQRSVSVLDFGDSGSGFRQRDWALASSAFIIEQRGGRDVLRRRDDRPFKSVALSVRAQPLGVLKDYEPVRVFSNQSAILYTGHFWPFRNGDVRYDAVFHFAAMDGFTVSAMGESGAALTNWRGFYRHPAFIYFGQQPAWQDGRMRLFFDPSMPGWLKDTIRDTLSATVSAFEEAFELLTATPPEIFSIYTLQPSQASTLRFSGDALPGQLSLAYSGGGWASYSSLGRELVEIGVAHEAAHLWQAAARPAHGAVPAWIHEGAAQAMAFEILAKTEKWSEAQRRDSFFKARQACAKVLRDGTLRTAAARGYPRASYDCGAVLMQVMAIAGEHDRSIIGFWKAYAARAAEQGGFDAPLLVEMAGEYRGDAFARQFQLFATTRHGNPAKAIERLYAAAKSH